jgi:hypothetical protein
MIGALLLTYILMIIVTATLTARKSSSVAKYLRWTQLSLAAIALLLSLPRSSDWLYWIVFVLGLATLYFVYLTQHYENPALVTGLFAFISAALTVLAAIATSDYRASAPFFGWKSPSP